MDAENATECIASAKRQLEEAEQYIMDSRQWHHFVEIRNALVSVENCLNEAALMDLGNSSDSE
jgi:hypothetical protein